MPQKQIGCQDGGMVCLGSNLELYMAWALALDVFLYIQISHLDESLTGHYFQFSILSINAYISKCLVAKFTLLSVLVNCFPIHLGLYFHFFFSIICSQNSPTFFQCGALLNSFTEIISRLIIISFLLFQIIYQPFFFFLPKVICIFPIVK